MNKERVSELMDGAQISYPLNYGKIKELENVFSIFSQGEFIGMIPRVRIDKDNIHIGDLY